MENNKDILYVSLSIIVAFVVPVVVIIYQQLHEKVSKEHGNENQAWNVD
jgi:hypothetical protein